MKHRASFRNKVVSAALAATLGLSASAYAGTATAVTGQATELSALGSYICVDSSRSFFYTLKGSVVQAVEINSGVQQDIFDFNKFASNIVDVNFYDAFVDGDKLYYLYQESGKSYSAVLDFSTYTSHKDTLNFRATQVGVTASGDRLYSIYNRGDFVYYITPDNDSNGLRVSEKVLDIYGSDKHNNVYYKNSLGITTAKYGNGKFVESGTAVAALPELNAKHIAPIEFLDGDYLADYTGNVFSISAKGALSTVVSFDRDDYAASGYAGEGSLTVSVPSANLIIGRNGKTTLSAYSPKRDLFVSSLTTAHEIYAVKLSGSSILCFEQEKGKYYYEIFPLAAFQEINPETVNLNEAPVYAGRTPTQVASQYSAAVGSANRSDSLYAEKGSVTAPYRAPKMRYAALNTLVGFSGYERWLAGLTPYRLGGVDTVNRTAMGATLLAAADTMGHTPAKPADMDESFYDSAYTTVGGNIYYGAAQTVGDAITGIRALLDDTANASNAEYADGNYYQGYNTPGHRNTFLQRGGIKVTYGCSDGKSGSSDVMLQYYEYAQSNPNATGTITQTDNNGIAYAWPAPGAFPTEEISEKACWTVYFNTDALNTGNDTPVVTVTDLDTGEKFVRKTVMHDKAGQREGYSMSNFWGKSLTFTPPKATSYDGKRYRVTVENLVNAKKMPATLTYTIDFFHYAGTYVIDGEEYRMDSDGKLTPTATQPPTTEPPTTEPPATEPPATEPTTQPADEGILGDVNKDGSVTISDVTDIQKYVSDIITLDAAALRCADVNFDGSVNITDATTVQKYIAGIISEFHK